MWACGRGHVTFAGCDLSLDRTETDGQKIKIMPYRGTGSVGGRLGILPLSNVAPNVRLADGILFD